MDKFNLFKNITEYFLALISSYKAILIGLIGGYLGTLIGLPLPWLLGSLGLNLCFAFTSYKIIFPTKLLNPIFLIVGIILGGTLNVTLLYKIHLWIFSSVAMLLCTIVSTILAGYYFFKVCKFSKFISVLAALPGAFVPISAALLEFGKSKNDKGVLIPQATRVIFIVSFVPIFFISKLGFSEMTGYNYQNIYDYKYFLEIVFLLIICFIFANILKRYKIPSPTLIGAMALSGAFYTFELVNARFPDALINIAFIFLGTALGTRLNGLKIKELLFFIFHGIIVSSILVIVAMITAYLLTFIGFEFVPTFLSFAPGGIHEMVVISVAYNIDPIFVSYHHFLRIFIIVLFLPFLLSKFKKTN
ncbi:AbrB family transcriptional regulator [Candidatus Pelagibacter sp.]|nr:AbrB family transcriptional regulator [Candidatus Pelagibacter sp.]